MVKPAEPKIDANGETAKLTCDKMVKLVNGKPEGAQENGKMFKPTGPEIDTGGKTANPLGDKMVNL